MTMTTYDGATDSGNTTTRSDLDSKPQISRMIDLFYRRVLADSLLRPVFVDTANIELATHLPLIKSYWAKLLLADTDYQRHTMDIHRALDRKLELQPEHFERWLLLFTTTVESRFSGPKADRALMLAARIASNMQRGLVAGRGCPLAETD